MVLLSSNALRLVVAFSALSTASSIDSINLDLIDDLSRIPLDNLGVSNLDQYNGKYEVTVGDADANGKCQYSLKVDFFHDQNNPAGDVNFNGVCDPNDANSAALHDQTRHWLQLDEYVEWATGFNHLSLQWRPCGNNPTSLRQPRYDMNFYTVIPQYRALMGCELDQLNNPKICQLEQTSTLGRGHFSIPVLWQDTRFIANMPVDFQPDPNSPEAMPYEGLISYDPDTVPATTDAWELPLFHMSSYDGDTIAFRALLPAPYVTGGNSAQFVGEQFYVSQTMNKLPSKWSMTYAGGNTGVVQVVLEGESNLCGTDFDAAKTIALSGQS
jgi:hypothetical protein